MYRLLFCYRYRVEVVLFGQCDQMLRLFVQYLDISSAENLPNSIKIVEEG